GSIASIESGRAEYKGAVVAADLGQHHALHRSVIELASVKKRLNQTEGWMIVQVVNQFDVPLKILRHLGIERFQAVTCSLFAQHRIELFDRAREFEQFFSLRESAFAELLNLFHLIPAEIHK